jgi:hypothetical protein
MKLTHIVDNKRVAKTNNLLQNSLKYKDPCSSLITLLEEELEFTMIDESYDEYKFTYIHSRIPHLLIQVDYNEAILHILYKGEIKHTINVGDVSPYYKIDDFNSQNYEETFNFIINKIRTLWGSK